MKYLVDLWHSFPSMMSKMIVNKAILSIRAMLPMLTKVLEDP